MISGMLGVESLSEEKEFSLSLLWELSETGLDSWNSMNVWGKVDTLIWIIGVLILCLAEIRSMLLLC